jgi:3-hydroxyisobutyrate dehydrogenase-like beta-hydroxyacid dehydrogenase
MRVGMIGTGHMGNPIARHLITSGNELAIYDRVQEATANLIELGATWVDDPGSVAAQCEVVFTSLPGPPEVDEAVLGEQGILAGAKLGTIHVDLTTNLPSSVRRIASIEEARGVSFLEAPLSGLVAGAEAGTLTIFVGGDSRTLETVRPLLEAFGKTIFHVGAVGRGNIMKLSNNMIIHASALLVQEALALGVKAGFDPMELYEMWNASSSSRFVQEIPTLIEGDYENPSFTLALAAKDIGLCVEAARDLAVPMSVASAASQVYTRSVARGYGRLMRQGGTLMTIEDEADVKIVKRRPGT